MFLIVTLIFFYTFSDGDPFADTIEQSIQDSLNTSPMELQNPIDIDPDDESDPDPPDTTASCSTNGGFAGDTGLKVWCWKDINLPQYSNKKGVSFSDGQLTIDSECYERQVTNSGDELKFHINPTNPEVESWCSRDFNMRAEIRTSPWNVNHPLGTEEWFGWTYRFGDTYKVDQNNQWKFFQVYPGPRGLPPQISLEIIHGDQFRDHDAGEIYIVNKGDSNNYTPSGITPVAGDVLKVVVHVIWGEAGTGLLQVWINNTVVYDKQVATVSPEQPWGGNAKWGIYKWPWADAAGVHQSLDQSITHLETYMGPLRVITRSPGDKDYGKNSYALVEPR